MYSLTFPHPTEQAMKVTFRVLYMAIWESIRIDNLNWITETVESAFFSNTSYPNNAQALYVFNVGLHEKTEADYERNLRNIFQLAKSKLLNFGKNYSKNKFLYRETTAQHFNLTAGYYDYFKMKKWRQINPWKRYKCVPSNITHSSNADWRHRAEINALNQNDHVLFVPFHNYTRHYHDIHPYTFYFARKKRKTIDVDCTHFYPLFGIILFRILWHSLLIH